MNHKDDGFLQEKIDAIFEAARIGNFKIPWSITYNYNKAKFIWDEN